MGETCESAADDKRHHTGKQPLRAKTADRYLAAEGSNPEVIREAVRERGADRAAVREAMRQRGCDGSTAVANCLAFSRGEGWSREANEGSPGQRAGRG